MGEINPKGERIRNSNGYLLKALIKSFDAEALFLEVVPIIPEEYGCVKVGDVMNGKFKFK